MFKKSGKICLAALAALTLNAGNQAVASCTDLISEEVTPYTSDEIYTADQGQVLAFGGMAGGWGISIVAGGSGALGAAFGAAAVSSTVYAYQDEIKEGISSSSNKTLNSGEAYAYSVLGSSTTSFNNIDPTLASFLKNVKREIGRDKNAIIPTDDEVIRAVETVNYDLSACSDENGEFYVPEKSDLVKTVVDYLNY